MFPNKTKAELETIFRNSTGLSHAVDTIVNTMENSGDDDDVSIVENIQHRDLGTCTAVLKLIVLIVKSFD